MEEPQEEDPTQQMDDNLDEEPVITHVVWTDQIFYSQYTNFTLCLPANCLCLQVAIHFPKTNTPLLSQLTNTMLSSLEEEVGHYALTTTIVTFNKHLFSFSLHRPAAW